MDITNNHSLQKRRCPGTNYNISYAICKGRQRVSYPKCSICQFKDKGEEVTHKIGVSLNMDIFKSYDIRGLFPNEINEYVIQRIGLAFTKFLKTQNPNVTNIVIGQDMRSSSRSLSSALFDGIKPLGVNIIDIGLVSTEMTYFAVGFYGFDASIMITASHNPSQYNGLKLCREKAIPISADTGLSTIAEIVRTSLPGPSDQVGKIIKKDIFDDYKKFILSFIGRQLKPLKIVVDAGNGMAGKIIPIVLNNIPCKIIPLYFELDGKFPNHDANPLEYKNMVDLQKKVVKSKADFGVAFDGDADRCFFVDETGNIINADIITVIIAKEFLAKEHGASIIYDLRSSKIVAEEIKASGGTPIRERVGHSNIKTRMREKNAIFAGELSGHYYYRDNYFSDSGLITLVQMMNIVSKKNISMSNLTSSLKKYHSSGEINFKVEDKDGKIKQLANEFTDGNIDYLDGITVEFTDWWFNVRKSNTEPTLRLNVEAKTRNILMEKTKALKNIINNN